MTGSLDYSYAWVPGFTVLDVQNGTADVKYTAASPIGVGPWTYQWSKYNPNTEQYDPIGGASGNSYEISAVDCAKQGNYRLQASDSCGGSATVDAYLSTASPAVSMASVILELNPSGGGTWTYTCQESTDSGASYHTYGPQGQNWLVMPTDDGTKSGYRYRITAQQGGTTASVTGSLDYSYAWSLGFTVLDVQNGSADVRYTATSPIGVGPWTYQWSKYNPNTGQYDPIGGANGNSYEISAVDCAKQGTYRVRASDSCGGSATCDSYLWRQGCQ